MFNYVFLIIIHVLSAKCSLLSNNIAYHVVFTVVPNQIIMQCFGHMWKTLA
jgi:hypothetical protein